MDIIDKKTTEEGDEEENEEENEEGDEEENEEENEEGDEEENEEGDEEENEEGDEEGVNQKNNDGKTKWQTLEHKGVLFPESFKHLENMPNIELSGKKIMLNYKNTENIFSISSEEAAYLFAQKKYQDDQLAGQNKKKITDDTVFRQNFWNDWKQILIQSKENIRDLEKKKLDDFNFTPLVNFIKTQKQENEKNKTSLKIQKKIIQDRNKNEYGWATIDGKKVELSNFTVPSPSLFIGHGDHPLRGKIVKRILPSDITINISKNLIPECEFNGRKCNWGSIVERKDLTWIASWTHPIMTNKQIYIFPQRAVNKWVVENDKNKFKKAQDLKYNIENIRNNYMRDLKSGEDQKRDLATAVYFLDILAIRPGSEKDTNKQAKTVGLTTLECKHITFLKNNIIKLEFIGKSSIEFRKEFEIDKIVYQNLRDLCARNQSSNLFPNISGEKGNALNAYLKSISNDSDMSAKVFRTYRASELLQQELQQTFSLYKDLIELSNRIKKIIYDKANTRVAIELNHQKISLSSAAKIDTLKKELNEELKNLEIAKDNRTKENLKFKVMKKELQILQLENNVSTSTSKDNYLDPRITVAWCKKVDMPIETIFTKNQLKKFSWSMETSSFPNWLF